MANDKDVLRQLRAFAWGFLSFPVGETSFSFEHDIAAHKTWGEQGEHLEATGVGSLVFDATIPFRNGIVPGPTENWKPSILYPDGLRAFVASMYRRDTLTLIHPEFGPVLCKPVRVRGKYDPNRRDGIDVEATWKQTMDDPDAPDPVSSDSPVEITGITLDLDVAAGSADALRALAPTLPAFTPDWTELLRQATGVVDQVGFAQRKVMGPLDQLSFRAANLINSLDRAGNSVTAWSVKNAAYRLNAAAEQLRQRITGHGRTGLSLYKVPAPTTLAAIAGFLHVPVAVILRLNPSLIADTVVPSGAVVRYPGPPQGLVFR
jgi:hypothetical protein